MAIVLDLFNREVVGWSLKPRMAADIVTDALTMAWFRKRPTAGLMYHSDRGTQYASHAFQDKLTEYGMICSMSRKETCWDNAPTESWFNSFKNEWVHGIRFATHTDMKATSFEYIEAFYAPKEVPLYVLFLNVYNGLRSVELVGKGMRGGKRTAFSTASVPVRRRRIVHKSTDLFGFGSAARSPLGLPSPSPSKERRADFSLIARTVAGAGKPAFLQGWV